MSFRSTAAPLTLALLLGLNPGAAERRVPTLDDLLTLRVDWRRADLARRRARRLYDL